MSGPPRGPAPAAPLFVERHTYRRRRLVDAGRALPVLGMVLWFLPLLWLNGARPVPASQALVYLFGVWIALPLAAWALNRAIARQGGAGYAGAESGAAPGIGAASGTAAGPVPGTEAGTAAEPAGAPPPPAPPPERLP
jgi:hypothetical protein